MAHLALYRKYRSQTFDDLIGQDHVVRTLRNAVASGNISHAYLFTGPRGTGKTSTARLLAKALNCTDGPSPNPPEDDDIVRQITEGSCLDVIEMDAASESGVDEVRERIVQVAEYRPNYCRYKIFIIDEVHDLSAKAFDALLKTIEEPPEHLVFILATTEYAKVPPTIRSRCQRYDFRRASLRHLQDRLAYVVQAEGRTAEPTALSAIARLADGGFRDALTLLEQALLVSEGELTLQTVYDQLGLIGEDAVDRILLAMREQDVKGLIEGLDAIYRSGRDPAAILDSMLYRVSDLTRAAYGIDSEEQPDKAIEANLHALAARLGRGFMTRLREKVASAQRSVRDVSLPRQWLEAELVALATAPEPAAPAAPAPVAAAVAAPRPAVARPEPEPAPKTVAAQPEPTPPKVAPAPDTDEGRAQVAWNDVVAQLGAISEVARGLLEGTRLVRLEGKQAFVGFEREFAREKVTKKAKLLAAVIEAWKARFPSHPELEFFVTSEGPPAMDTHDEAVALPAEGRQLVDLAKDVFKGT